MRPDIGVDLMLFAEYQQRPWDKVLAGARAHKRTIGANFGCRTAPACRASASADGRLLHKRCSRPRTPDAALSLACCSALLLHTVLHQPVLHRPVHHQAGCCCCCSAPTKRRCWASWCLHTRWCAGLADLGAHPRTCAWAHLRGKVLPQPAGSVCIGRALVRQSCTEPEGVRNELRMSWRHTNKIYAHPPHFASGP